MNTETTESQGYGGEAEDVKQWFKRIDAVREYDAPARKQYASDRRYARGDSGEFDVDVPIAPAYIEVLTSFLYAKDPDVDALPAESAGESRLEQARLLGKTVACVVRRLWHTAQLKKHAGRMVRSGLTVGIGWLKSTWQEQTGQDPVILQQISSLQDNLQRIAQTQKDMAENGDGPDSAIAQELQQQITGLEAKVERIVSRFLAIDFVAAEDITVSMDVIDIAGYVDSPWISHRAFIPVSRAKTQFPKIAEKLKNAKIYTKKAVTDMSKMRHVGAAAGDIDASEADSYQVGGQTEDCEGYVRVEEVWHRTDTMVLTLVEGIDCYAVDPYSPKPATKRWYPFFNWSPIQTDGERHPTSLITRSQALLDEYNRIRDAFRRHRARCIPKTAFNSAGLEKGEAEKLAKATVGEMVPIKPIDPSMPVGNLLQPIAYAVIDPALYDTAPIRAELEMIWGIQEALSSTIHTAKTATEAEIQQSGTDSRNSYKRDSLDEVMTELANYTAQVALGKLPAFEAQKIAGPEAFWPENMTIDDIDDLLVIDIRAGSTGKPNTTQQREAWAATMPLLQNAIMQIGQLRMSPPEVIADCIEQLVSETLERSGDHLDPSRFLPAAPTPEQMAAMPPPIPPEGAPTDATIPPPQEQLQ